MMNAVQVDGCRDFGRGSVWGRVQKCKNVCGKTIKIKYIEIKLCLLNVQNANSLPKCLVEIYNRFAEFLFHIKKNSFN